MPIADPDAYPAVIVNDKLGESAGSLLFEILRLQHGYTYGAYSRVFARQPDQHVPGVVERTGDRHAGIADLAARPF